MKYVLFSNDNNWVLPNGEKATVENLKKDFPTIEMSTYAAVVTDGVVCVLNNLSMLKNEYGIDEDDNLLAIEKINDAIEDYSPNIASLSEVKSQIDENTQAVAELGVIAYESQTSDADLLQAVGELGVKVAELSAKLDALQQ